MLKCREVTRRVGGVELEEMRFFERIAVRMHLFMCRHCRMYASQLAAIREAAQMAWRDGREEEILRHVREHLFRAGF
jgi:hypothetical protein